MSNVAPYGSWSSPFTTEMLAQSTVRLGGPFLAAGDIWWSELRPTEGGRVQVVRRGAHGRAVDQLPEGFSARSRVHEYGGGAWWLHGDLLFIVNWEDQRIWRLDPDGSTHPLTPDIEPAGSHRYADGRVTADGRWLICVRERHEGGEVYNELVAVRADLGDDDTGQPLEPAEPTVLWFDADFVSHPRVDKTDGHLAWIQWNHPDMPWDASQLWVAGLDTIGESVTLEKPERVMGGGNESLTQPEWSPTGHLHVVSDADGWWNLWAFSRPGRPAAGTATQVTKVEGELAAPQWVFGQSTYCFTATTHMVGIWRFDGIDHLGVMRRDDWGDVTWIDTPYTALEGICAGDGSEVAMLAGSFTAEHEVVSVDADLLRPGRIPPFAVRRPAHDLEVDPAWVSIPRPVTFPSDEGREAHALYYPPHNPEFDGPSEERPPLLVLSHGGPTASARPVLQRAVQAFTSRGWAVVDVNYGGSTGFGRPYRRLLDGRWGEVDVADCANAAHWLAEQGLADGDRLVIKGGSAGGFTTLAALTFRGGFAAGSSHYGVADLEALARDTHKFESRYLDRLVGPYPEAAELYRQRSPIHHVDRLACPIILLQGAEDAIVPPEQARAMADAVASKGLPVAMVVFDGEQHGFRKADTIKRALEAELYFFAKVLGFEPADELAPVEVRNL
ncbi:MAG: S9 family peptidase [Acidimicrobiia bacterium]|nr:S9 family peptidase [Acidimicrobiia bacterium]